MVYGAFSPFVRNQLGLDAGVSTPHQAPAPSPRNLRTPPRWGAFRSHPHSAHPSPPPSPSLPDFVMFAHPPASNVPARWFPRPYGKTTASGSDS
jgi:hypothetical protein